MTTRAVLFDFGGTLYDYSTLLPGEAESLLQLCEWVGLRPPTFEELRRAQREAMRQVFRTYLPRGYYLHRDLFRDAVVGMLRTLGAEATDEQLDRFRQLQWQGHQRDLRLRDGVLDTLQALRERGLHVGMVSNIDEDQLDHLVGAADLRPYFDSLLSSERAGACKPAPAIFAEALRRAGCAPAEALFVGDTLAQDVAGAKRAGMRAALIWHRDDTAPPQGEVQPDHVIRAIPELLELV